MREEERKKMIKQEKETGSVYIKGKAQRILNETGEDVYL